MIVLMTVWKFELVIEHATEAVPFELEVVMIPVLISFPT